MGGSLSDGALAGLRALGGRSRSLRTQLFAATAYVSGGLIGAAIDGAHGSAWGVAIATSDQRRGGVVAPPPRAARAPPTRSNDHAAAGRHTAARPTTKK